MAVLGNASFFHRFPICDKAKRLEASRVLPHIRWVACIADRIQADMIHANHCGQKWPKNGFSFDKFRLVLTLIRTDILPVSSINGSIILGKTRLPLPVVKNILLSQGMVRLCQIGSFGPY